MDIAIVGAGAAAVALLDAMATTPVSPGRISVFEPGEPWRGRPYAQDLDSVLVNAPPAIMSIRHGDATHYAFWLGSRGTVDPWLGQPLVPRAFYGDYLADTAETALGALRERGWEVEVVAARVTGAGRDGSLVTEDGRVFAADRIALCVGAGTPHDHYGLDGVPGFVGDPYPLARTLDGVTGDVVVIGSGLTAVDVVVSLAARGHTGAITLVSRTGRLPYVWQRPVGYEPRHLTVAGAAALGEVTLEGLIGLLRAELAEAGEDFDAFAAELGTPEDPVAGLERQLAATDDPRIGRRVLQQAAHTVGPYAWRLLPEADRAWLRGHSRLAIGLASPMVPVNAAVLMRLFRSGQLTVRAGVRKIEAVQGGFTVRLDDAEISAYAVINAVNPPPQAVPRAAERLVTSLLEAGLAALHPSGGLVPADPRLRVVGDLAGGGPYITSGIPGIAAQGYGAAKG